MTENIEDFLLEHMKRFQLAETGSNAGSKRW